MKISSLISLMILDVKYGTHERVSVLTPEHPDGAGVSLERHNYLHTSEVKSRPVISVS